MAYTILVNSTTADANDVNNNFYHIAQGTRLPMGGASLEATDSAYDLGSSAATWNNLFCENLYINNEVSSVDKSFWVLETEITLTTTATSIEFTGLNGDEALEYRIEMETKEIETGGTQTLNHLVINSDSGTNYGGQYIYSSGVQAFAKNTTSASSFDVSYLGPYNFCAIVMNAKTGFPRMAMIDWHGQMAGSNRLESQAGAWNNSTSTVTTLKFYVTDNPYTTNTTIRIWKRN